MILIYGRQSVDKKDSISIETQIDFCKKQIMNDEPYEIFIDKGYSGGNIRRPDFERMMLAVETGAFHKLIVYKVDRISRSLLDFADIMDRLAKYKVEFCSATETFDTATAFGRAMLNILMVFAQLEREQIQIRITDNYYARGKKGFFLGGPPSYGFSKVATKTEDGHKTSKLVPNDKMRNYFKIAEMVLKNCSLNDVSRYLSSHGIKTAEEANWDSSKISKLLRNPVYVKANADVYTYYSQKGVKIVNDISEFNGQKGCFLYGKRPGNERKYTNVKDHTLSLGLHDGVIEPEPWLKIQRKLESNLQLGNTGKGKNSWLSGLVKCGYCNYSLTVVKTQKKKGGKAIGKVYRKFYCSGHRAYHICDITVGKDADMVEEAVRVQIFERIQEMKTTICNLSESNLFSINQIKLGIIAIDQQIAHIVNQICQGGAALTKLLNEKAELLAAEKKCLELKLEQELKAAKTDCYDDLRKCLDAWDTSTLAQKKAIAQELIERISVKDMTIDIQWKI